MFDAKRRADRAETTRRGRARSTTSSGNEPGKQTMKLYRTKRGMVIEQAGRHYRPRTDDWDALITADKIVPGETTSAPRAADLLPPIGTQEVWAAGVTYYRSRDARMDEAKAAGGGDFYARVYDAPRPEIFFKSAAHRVVGPGQAVRIRRDSKWNVPEPELTLVINRTGRIVGCTVGNDMSSRDIEGENPLYLPQAKMYDGSCAVGPCVLLAREPLPPETEIAIEIRRRGKTAFAGNTTLARIKRPLAELAAYLYRELNFPAGAYLMTGTGIVPPNEFTLAPGDEIGIAIDPIGTLTNTVA